ncbi:hypothetical protein SFC79_01235 [Nocardioides sp. S-58]|uniref:DUF559 domain-containing protein n=1 Tax=Nocardioides renjunii TaxID=3095075 RepID=A0ABU5K5Y0_9ACTN|nr:hypothetical protein [Nocardioides sp. S-58]MDZ5660372.1 hypothetical protein [Nocardioides sp. S-58]
MDEHRWSPRTPRATDLVRPLRVDVRGVSGPTKSQARGPRWRQTSAGMYVPADTDGSHVEQRILEQGSRIRMHGAVTGWAALRWRGATFFDGTAAADELLPVPVVVGHGLLRPDPRISISWEQLPPGERELVDGVWTAVAERALFDEVRRHRILRQAVVDIEMAIAAREVSAGGFRAYVASRNAWTGVGLARDVAAVAGLGCWSPQEVRMVLAWMWDADLPRPLCNTPVFDLDGNLLAIPDLFDEIGCAGEYQGADHKDGQRHRQDVARHERLRTAGIEVFEVVGGDLLDTDLVVARMRAARERCLLLPPDRRRWTLERPAWWEPWARTRGLESV